MDRIAVCFLAYGDEHINEFNLICESLLSKYPSINVFVCTNDETKIANKTIHIITTDKEFNYNLKLEAIKSAFEKFSLVVCLDTDIRIDGNVDFSLLNNLESDGFYTTVAPYTIFTHNEQKISVLGLIKNTEYGKKVQELNTVDNLTFLDEQRFIIKLESEEYRNNFITHWENIFEKTKEYHINNGIYEGLIISSACSLSGLNIFYTNTNVKLFLNSFTHYGWDTKILPKPSLI